MPFIVCLSFLPFIFIFPNNLSPGKYVFSYRRPAGPCFQFPLSYSFIFPAFSLFLAVLLSIINNRERHVFKGHFGCQ